MLQFSENNDNEMVKLSGLCIHEIFTYTSVPVAHFEYIVAC